jgi:hypothetical protein
MRLDLTITYLISSFLNRLFGFFVHWYGHTFFIFKKGLQTLKKKPSLYWPAFLMAIIIYFVWALIPIWLVIRIFYIV